MSLNLTTAQDSSLLPECRFSVEWRLDLIQQGFNKSKVTSFSTLPASTGIKITFLFFLTLILFTGLLFNLSAIIWIIKGKPKRVNIDLYMISLSIADLVTVISRVPFHIALVAVDGNLNNFQESHSQIFCKAGAYLQTATIFISLLTMDIIAVDRYVAVCHPLFHYKLKSRRNTLTAVVTIVLVWLIGLSVSIKDVFDNRLSLSLNDIDHYEDYNYQSPLAFVEEEIVYVPDVDYYNKHKTLIPGVTSFNSTCEVLNLFRACTHTSRDERVNTTILFVLIYVVPQLVLGYCYIRISHCLWVRKRVGTLLVNPQQASPAPNVMTKRTIIVMIVMVTTFGILWLPYWCNRMYTTFDTTSTRPVQFDVSDMAITLLTYLSVTSSPLIYLIMDRGFWASLKGVCERLGKCGNNNEEMINGSAKSQR